MRITSARWGGGEKINKEYKRCFRCKCIKKKEWFGKLKISNSWRDAFLFTWQIGVGKSQGLQDKNSKFLKMLDEVK
jgi:hypothetical protein